MVRQLLGWWRESLFFRTILVSGVVIVLLGGAITQLLLWHIEAIVLEKAARDAEDQARPRILKMVSGSDLAQPIRGEAHAVLDQMVRDYLLVPTMVRLKLWSPAGVVVYSTLPGQVGESSPENWLLQLALQGKTVWQLTTEPHSPHELGLGRLLEVYIPLAWEEGGTPGGVLEVYLLHAPYERHGALIRNAIFLTMGLLAPTLPVTLYLLYRTGWIAISRERDRLATSEKQERELRSQLDGALDGVLIFLARLMDHKEAYTAGHAQRVAALAWGCAARLGLPLAEQEQARLAGLLHDIGKLAIDTEMLLRPGPLSPEEMAGMRQHTVLGEEILGDVPYLAEVASAVRHHHERWDGAGYPDGLAGEAVPLLARVVAACDAYDAMTTGRPYRAARTRLEAVVELEALAGSQFDPQVVSALTAYLRAEGEMAVAEAGEQGIGLLTLGPLAGLDPLSLHRTLIEQVPSGVGLLGLDARLLFVNGRFCRLLGMERRSVAGRLCYELPLPCRERLPEQEGPCADCLVVRAIQTQEPSHAVRQYNDKVFSLTSYPLGREGGSPVGATLFIEDVTERLLDSLTGSYNYRLFQEMLEAETAQARRYKRPFSLVVLDVDGFKAINDRWGHPYGDEVLRRLAQLLRSQSRGSDLLFRTGGDEFALVCPESDGNAARILARRLGEAVRQSFSREELSISWGVAAMPEDGAELSPGELYALADRRLYDKKAE